MIDFTRNTMVGVKDEDKNLFDRLGDWWKENIYLANPDGTRADTTVKDLLRGPTIEFEETGIPWKPSIFLNDPFKAGTVVTVEDDPDGEGFIIVQETDASRTQLVGDSPDSHNYGGTDAQEIGGYLIVGLVTVLISLLVGLIID